MRELLIKAGFPLGGIIRAQRKTYCFSSKSAKKRTLKRRIKFNFSATEISANRSYPSKHTTLFQRPSDVRNVQMTLERRQNNILC